MKLFKKMAAKQARMENTPQEPDPKERERARREQMKRKAGDSAGRDGQPVQSEGGSGGNAKVQELIEARHRSTAHYEKKRQAIMARIGNGIDKHEAARQLKELEEFWHAEQLAIKTRLREMDPSL
jgi:hypothetical protein